MLLDAIKLNESTYFVGSDMGLGCAAYSVSKAKRLNGYRILLDGVPLAEEVDFYPCLVVLRSDYNVQDNIDNIHIESVIPVSDVEAHLRAWRQQETDARLHEAHGDYVESIRNEQDDK